MAGYIGLEPIPRATRTLTEGVFSSDTTSLSIPGGFEVGQIAVYLDGLKLRTGEYTGNLDGTIDFLETIPAGTAYVVEEITSFNQANHYTKDEANELFGQSVSSVSTLRTSSFPANVQRLYLEGYYGQGTPGGNRYFYRVGSGFTSADDDGGKELVDTDGVKWKDPDEAFATPEMFGAKNDFTVNDFDAFNAMGEWLKADKERVARLAPNGDYYLSYTGDMFFNGIEGDGASVTVDNGGFFTYLRSVQDDIFHVKNVNIYKVGDRLGEDDSGSNKLYSDSNSEIGVARCSDVHVYGLTDKDDRTSWVDDTNKTRFGGFVRVKAKDSHFENVLGFGLGLHVNVRAVAGGRHVEKNVKVYNGETSLWVFADNESTDIYDYGSIDDIAVINTAAQKDYWIGKNVGTDRNGKDSLLHNAKHNKINISRIEEKNAIERSIYYQNENASVDNIVSYGGGDGAHFKTGDDVLLKNNSVSNLKARISEESGSGVYNFESQEDFSASVINVLCPVKLQRPAFALGGGGVNVNVSDATVINTGSILRVLKATDEKNTSGIRLSRVNAHNVHNGQAKIGTLVNVEPDTGERIGAVEVSDITHTVDSPDSSKFSRSAYYFQRTDGIVIRNAGGWSQRVPFRCSDCTDINVKSSEFNVATDTSIAGVWLNLEGQTEFAANNFDFSVSCNDPIESIPSSFKARFTGDSAAPIQCAESWKEIVINLDIPDNTSFFITIPVGDKYSFDVSASIGDSQLVLSNDGSGSGSMTVIRNNGSRLSNTDTQLFRIYNNGNGDVVLRTDSTSLTGGQLKVVMTR